jgi:Na+/alanine symporter
MIASTYQKKNLSEELSQGGLATLKTGLFLQLIGLAAFTTVALRFMFVSRSWDSNSRPSAMDSRPTWRQLAWAIVLAIILLTVSRNPGKWAIVSDLY